MVQNHMGMKLQRLIGSISAHLTGHLVSEDNLHDKLKNKKWNIPTCMSENNGVFCH